MRRYGKFVDLRVIQQRMDRKDARMQAEARRLQMVPPMSSAPSPESATTQLAVSTTAAASPIPMPPIDAKDAAMTAWCPSCETSWTGQQSIPLCPSCGEPTEDRTRGPIKHADALEPPNGRWIKTLCGSWVRTWELAPSAERVTCPDCVREQSAQLALEI